MTDSFDWHKEAKAQWDDRAAFWNERSTKMWDNGSRKDIVAFIEKYLKRNSRILDVGCGDGYGSSKLHRAGYRVTGIDISAEMIALARKRSDQDEMTFLQGNVESMPFEEKSNDGAMVINVLEWTKEPSKALDEFYRVLKPGGVLCVGILGPTAGPRANGFPRLKGEEAICNTMMPWEFQQLAAEKDFHYVDGFGVYKEGVTEQNYKDLPLNLKQALTFMWVFMLRKAGE